VCGGFFEHLLTIIRGEPRNEGWQSTSEEELLQLGLGVLYVILGGVASFKR
jgi:hypothetical protein